MHTTHCSLLDNPNLNPPNLNAPNSTLQLQLALGYTNFLGQRAKFPIDSMLWAASQTARGGIRSVAVQTCFKR